MKNMKIKNGHRIASFSNGLFHSFISPLILTSSFFSFNTLQSSIESKFVFFKMKKKYFYILYYIILNVVWTQFCVFLLLVI